MSILKGLDMVSILKGLGNLSIKASTMVLVAIQGWFIVSILKGLGMVLVAILLVLGNG